MAEWRRGVLKAIGAPVTPANLRFLDKWQRWEGGHTNNNARFNWLNTTRGTGESINSVGVKRFNDFQTGIRYTAETLMNGRYDDIVRALQSGNPLTEDMSRGLQVWVSGRPDGNPGYAEKVMGTKVASGGGGGGGRSLQAAAIPSAPKPPSLPSLPDDFLYEVWGDMTPLFKRISKRFAAPPPLAAPQAAPAATPDAHGHSEVEFVGKKLVLPTSWKSTHVTDGLSEEGFRSAIDIMGASGTPVGAPEAGRVVRWDPEGAQGGGSMWFQGASGRMYWIGHIANGLQPGSRVKRGQVIASISPDHPRPHVHLDRR